ncbi:MAG: energy transducer TonB [Flavobacteriales bacterium]|nr:energy transducer TonB [Flavobacteriales bacterium]
MESKKSKGADLENRRGSILLLGLVCATSATLMSFEYANFQIHHDDDLMSSADIEEPTWEMTQIEVVYSSAPQQEQPKVIEYVAPDPNPEPDPSPEPDPTPDPDPNPNPGPFPPGPPGPPPGPPVPEPMPIIDPVYEVVEEMPEFPGGIEALYEYLADNIKYPQMCVDNNVQGKAYIRFTVEKDGSISNLEVIKSAHKLLDKEAVRVVGSMPKWKPGKQLNKVVRVSYTLPINFILNN